MTGDFDRTAAIRLDADDPLASLRDRYELPAGTIYLDGNSLGALPRDTARHVSDVVTNQWGGDLISSWNRHDWIGMPSRIGGMIAPLIGAAADEVIVCDSTSINLLKLVLAALTLRPNRKRILTESGGFPTDRYITDAAASLGGGHDVFAVPRENVLEAIDETTALVVLTHVDYRTGHKLDMAVATAAAHARGALVLWDLSHSTGAVRVDLGTCGADLAVGCGYKYLNGGPGAPAYLFAARALQPRLPSLLSGWLGHARPFSFEEAYAPAEGMARFLCGTPPILSMAALETGVSQFREVNLDALFAKGSALSDLFIARVRERCAGHGFELASPVSAHERGCHVSYAHEHAYAICQALIARGVIGDFRAPNLLRMGFAPAYTRFVDVFDAVEILAEIMDVRGWDQERFRERKSVT